MTINTPHSLHKDLCSILDAHGCVLNGNSYDETLNIPKWVDGTLVKRWIVKTNIEEGIFQMDIKLITPEKELKEYRFELEDEYSLFVAETDKGSVTHKATNPSQIAAIAKRLIVQLVPRLSKDEFVAPLKK